MNVLTVIPIAKGIPRDELSYFSARDVALGTLVTVPFGGRTIRAVVVEKQEARDLKASIKTESFKLKNISEIHPGAGLPSSVFAAAQSTARFFAQPIGVVLETMLPKPVFEHYIQESDKKALVQAAASTSRPLREIQLLQIPLDERLSTYKTLIRENLAKGASTMVIVPTVSQAEQWFAALKTGIEDRIVSMHGKKTKKQVESGIARAVHADPVVLVATAPFSSLARSDWGTIVIEASSSPYYRQQFGASFDMRAFVESISGEFSARLVYADSLLDVSLRARLESRTVTDLRSTWHVTGPANRSLADMRGNPDEKKPFQLLGAEARAMVENAVARGEKVFLVAARNGLAPLTVCSDCQTTVSCPNCQTPLVLHRKKTGSSESRTYMCHHCMLRTPPIDRCANCGGSRLAMLGISTDVVAEEVSKLFPDAVVFLANDEDERKEKTIKSWQAAESGILVGTHGIVHAVGPVQNGCIVSIDTILSLPNYTAAESCLQSILGFLEIVQSRAVIQTRNAGADAIRAVASENLYDFVREEHATRKQFGYPPDRVLVKVAYEAAPDAVADVTAYFEQIFERQDPDIIMKKSRKPGMQVVQALLKVDAAAWNDPHSPLAHAVRSLPREFHREVNPDSVF